MKLLCLGDLAITQEEATHEAWLNPLDGRSREDQRILLNWEFPIGTEVNPLPRSSGKRFLAHPDSPEIIRSWAPGFASLATNHLLDAGAEGIAHTVKTLENIGFQTFGAGNTQEEIEKPLVWETGQGKLTVINWVFAETHPDWGTVPGVNCWPGIEQARKIVANLRGETDWLMALLHWSDELFAYPRPEDRQIARQLAEAGFDLIVAHHPHVVRGMEYYGDIPVFYSLGNFFFSGNFEKKTGRMEENAPLNREGLGLIIDFKRDEKPAISYLSFWQEKNMLGLDPHQRAEKRLRQVSQPLEIKDPGQYNDWYQKKRQGFDRWGARWQFVIRRLGFLGLIRYLANRLRKKT